MDRIPKMNEKIVDLNIITHMLLPLAAIVQAEHEGVFETIQTLRRRKEEIMQTIDWMDHFFETELIWHFRKEEVILSILQEVGDEAKTISNHILTEHREFREMHSQFKRLAQNLRVAGLNEFLNLCEMMMQFIENHAFKEDTSLFPLVNRVLSKEQMDEAFAKIVDIEKEQQEMKRKIEGEASRPSRASPQ